MEQATRATSFSKALKIATVALLLQYGVFANASSPAAAAKGAELDLAKGESRVEFLAIGKPSALKIRGKGGPLEGRVTVKDTDLKGNVAFALETLDTGIELRNSHMKEKYLQTKEFPKAELSITKASLPAGWMTKPGKFQDLPFEGTLKLHGVEKPLSGKLSFSHDGKTVDGTAGFKLKVTDYGISVPSYAGVTVTDDVEVEAFFKSPFGGATN